MAEQSNFRWSAVDDSTLMSPGGPCEGDASYGYAGTDSNQFCDLMAHMMAGTSRQLGAQGQTTSVTRVTSDHAVTGSLQTSVNTTEQLSSTDHMRCMITNIDEEPDSENTVQAKPASREDDSVEEGVHQTERQNFESQEAFESASHITQQPVPSKQGKTHTDLTKYAVPFGGNQLFICDHCSQMFIDESGLACHLETHPDKSPVEKQPVKRKPYRTKYTNRKANLQSQTDEKRFICKECGYSTNHRFKLTAHAETHGHAVGKSLYKCDQCSYSSVKKKTMDKHMLKHTKLPVGRKDCVFTTSEKADLEKHTDTHTAELSDKLYKCDQCHYSAVLKKTLKLHKLMKHNQKDPPVEELHEAATLAESKEVEEAEVCTKPTVKSERCEQDVSTASEEMSLGQDCEEEGSLGQDCEEERSLDQDCEEEGSLDQDCEEEGSLGQDCEEEGSLDQCEEASSVDEASSSADEDYVPAMSDISSDDMPTEHAEKPLKTKKPRKTKKTFACSDEECDFVADTKRKLKAHSKKHQTSDMKQFKYKCKECDYTSKHKSDLRQHKFKHTGKWPFVCKECGYKTGKRNAMAMHTRIHTGEKPFKCTQCPFAFTQNSALRAHMAKHTGEKPFMCDVCGFRFSLRAKLNAHMKIHSGKMPAKSFKCEECNYATAYKTHLAVHVARHHTGEKPHMCEYCGYRTVDRSNLATHKKTHTGDRPFKCDMCDYCTVNKHKLAQHKAKHTGDKPFACTLCEFRTVYKPSLVTHMQTHSGEKPFKCDQCDYRAARKTMLKSHMTKHTGDKPHVCPECGHRTAHRCNLLSHIRKIHHKDKSVVSIDLPKADMMDLLFPFESGANTQ